MILAFEWTDYENDPRGRVAEAFIEDTELVVWDASPTGWHRWDAVGGVCGQRPTIAESKAAAEEWLRQRCAKDIERANRILAALDAAASASA